MAILISLNILYKKRLGIVYDMRFQAFFIPNVRPIWVYCSVQSAVCADTDTSILLISTKKYIAIVSCLLLFFLYF